MRRLIALLLSAATAACLLTACGGGEGREEDLLCDAAGVSPDAVLLTVDGREVPAGRYLYWLAYGVDTTAQSYLLQGLEVPWDMEMSSGKTVEEGMMEAALETAALYALLPVQPQAEGLSPSAETQQQLLRGPAPPG